MKVLVANLGSTSFKYRLYDMTDERQLARGGTERIGAAESRSYVEIGEAAWEMTGAVPDHAVAVRQCLAQLTDAERGCLQEASEIAAIGFKAVHGGELSGAVRITPDVLDAIEKMNGVAPAHNPAYARAMRLLAEQLPEIPLVAAFETGFHQAMPARNRTYAIPRQWTEEYEVRRYGFHGASHRYIATRTAELRGTTAQRVISCHLGGSSSLCAIRDGVSQANSLGMSPHNNRVGDFDPFALPVLMEATGKTLDALLEALAEESGLLGMSETSGDVRDLESAADTGDARAELALGVYVSAIRHYLGAYLVELGGAEAVVVTGGIGENSARIRRDVCRELETLGIRLDAERNANATGETTIHADDSRTELWVVPTNEEIIVARQTRDVVEGS